MSISYSKEILPRLDSIRERLRGIEAARRNHDWKEADLLRDSLHAIDSGMEVNYAKTGKVSLWHRPNPPFPDQFHYANYPEFIANSWELHFGN